jgi:protein-tyrosine phosphatase
MAQGYFEKRLKDLDRREIKVSSAGIFPSVGMEATEEAKQVAKEDGSADISNHRTRIITEQDVKDSDLIFVMELRHKLYILSKYPYASNKIYLLKEFKKIGDFEVTRNPDIADPIGKDINFYRNVFAVIKESIERILKQI